MEDVMINHLAVVAAALSMFVLGGLWYGPLFGKTWMDVNGFTEERLKDMNVAKIYGFSFLFALVMAYNLAWFLSTPDTDLAWGAAAGFLAGFGWVALGIGIVSLFERRSWKYVLVNGGYMTVAFTIMGVIIGAWR